MSNKSPTTPDSPIQSKFSTRIAVGRVASVIGLIVIFESLYFMFLGDIMNPRFSYIGDEFTFFEFAQYLLQTDKVINPLSAGVYQGNSKLASILQAAVMYFFSDRFLGWRISSAILPSILALSIYIWVALLFDHKKGLIACILCLCSSYLRNFALVPYPNIQGTIWFVVVLSLITYQHRYTTSTLQVVFAGACMGLSTYFYYGVAIPLFVSAYTLCLFFTPQSNIRLRTLFLWGVFATVLLLPALYEQTMLSNILWRTAPDRPLLLNERVLNIKRAFLALWSSDRGSHYVTGSFIDSISGFAALIGILWAGVQGMRQRGEPLALFMLWLSVTISIGALNGYFYGLAITRSHFLLVPAFALAAQGLYVLASASKERSGRRAILITACLLTATLNVFRIHEGRQRSVTTIACMASQSEPAEQDIPPMELESRLTPLKPDIDPIKVAYVLRLYKRKPSFNSSSENRLRPILSSIREGCRI